jgi:FecR protein
MTTKAPYDYVLTCALTALLCVPSEIATAADTPGRRAGEVSRVIPTVNIVRGAKTFNASAKTVVDWLDVVNTQASARARIALDDGSVLNVGSDSSIKVVKHDGGTQQTELELTYGKLRSQAQKITKPDGKFQVRTPAGVAGLVGTDFFVSYDNTTGTMNVTVFEGIVKVCSLAGACVEVKAGQLTNVRTNDNAGPQPPTEATLDILMSARSGTEISGEQGVPAGVAMFSRDVSIGSVPLSVGSTVYSGELLKVGKNGHLRIQVGKSHFAFAPMSAARIFRSSGRTIVELHSGAFAYSTEITADRLTIYAGDVQLVPIVSEPASGQIALLSLCSIFARVTNGALEITSTKEALRVRAKQEYIAYAETGVAFSDPAEIPRTILPPDWSDPQFHLYHKHVTCDVTPPRRPPLHPATQGSYNEVMITGITTATIIVLVKAVESPDRP